MATQSHVPIRKTQAKPPLPQMCIRHARTLHYTQKNSRPSTCLKSCAFGSAASVVTTLKSGFGRCKREDQQAYFLQCLDSTLAFRLGRHITPATEVFGAGSCIELLEAEFLHRYPLFTRRLMSFKYEQQGSQ